MKKYSDWLSTKIIFFEKDISKDTSGIHDFGDKNIGRPQKLFDESSDRSRKRKLKPLLEQNTVDEIVLAAEMSLRSTCRRDAAHLIKEVTSHSPKRATKIKKSIPVTTKF